MKTRHGFTILLIMIFFTISIPVAEASSDTPLYKINLDQNENRATMNIDPSPGHATIYWDFDDGTFDTGYSVSHTWMPGLYNVKAVIVKEGITSVAEGYIGIYSESPVTEIQRNAEYRYAVYVGDDAELTLIDSNGKLQSWLTYDKNHRTVTGIPRETGTYHATLSGDSDTVEWPIMVSYGSTVPDWIRFSAHSDNGNVILDDLYSSASGTLRYSWTLSNLDGFLISASEGRDPNLTATPGVYKLTLKAQGKDSYTSYSQFIVLDGEESTMPETTFDTSAVITISTITAVIAALFYVSTRDPRALLGTAVSILITAIFLVI